MNRTVARLVMLLALTAPAAAHAATVRSFATLTGPVVRLSDLFDDAGSAGARVLGPAPPPGGRITVGAAQLGAIAQGYGIAWQPDDMAQAVLERPGAPLPIESVTTLLRPALVAQGATGAFDIALPFYDPPMLDAAIVPRLSLQHVALDLAAGRFSAIVLVDTGDASPTSLRLAGSIEQSVAVAVPTRRLLAGMVIAPGDLALRTMPARAVTALVVQDPAQAVGLQLRRMAFPGQPLPLADLAHPQLVAKGDRVMVGLVLPGLDVGAVGEALGAGAAGDRISVRNPVSGAVLTAEVIGAGQVRVEADAPPALPAANGYGGALPPNAYAER